MRFFCGLADEEKTLSRSVVSLFLRDRFAMPVILLPESLQHLCRGLS
jgi:hypothetical protein